MIEGSGSGAGSVSLTNGSGSGSPKTYGFYGYGSGFGSGSATLPWRLCHRRGSWTLWRSIRARCVRAAGVPIYSRALYKLLTTSLPDVLGIRKYDSWPFAAKRKDNISLTAKNMLHNFFHSPKVFNISCTIIFRTGYPFRPCPPLPTDDKKIYELGANTLL